MSYLMKPHEKNARCPSCGRWVQPDNAHAFFGPTIEGKPANDLDVPNAEQFPEQLHRPVEVRRDWYYH